MKTNLFKYCLILSALLLGSCDKILDVTIRSSITGQNFWQNESDFNPYMTGIYARYRSHMDDMSMAEDRSEMWKQGYNARFSPYWAQSITAGNTVDWTSYYGTIGHCNLLLEKIEPFPFINTVNKSRIKAEAYAMRATIYFHLAKIWGDVPLVLKSVANENEPLYPRSPVAEVFTQINADITQALSLFPEADFVDKYRFSKPSVYALLADVKMWSGKVLGGGTTDINAAINAIGEVEKSSAALMTTYGSIFDSRKNSEIILSLYLNRSEYTSSAYTNAFLRFDTSSGADNATDLPMSLVGQQAYCLSPEALAFYAKYPADKRISRTYIPEIMKGVVKNYWPNKFIGTKYSDDRIPDSDFIIYRLSDMYLLKAEAYAALGQVDNANIYLNKVKQRAGIPLYTETTKALVEREILDERGRELYHENKRWWDLVRAHKSGVLDIYQYIPNLKGKTTPFYWAVHTNVLAKNSKLVQTAGY